MMNAIVVLLFIVIKYREEIMKKRISKVLSGLIILTMVATSTGLTFAAEKGLDIKAVENDRAKAAASQNADILDNIDMNTAVSAELADDSSIAFSPKGAALTPVEYLPMDAPALFSDKSEISPFWVGNDKEPIDPGTVAVVPVVAKTTGIMYVDGGAECENTSHTCKVKVGTTASEVIDGSPKASLYIDSGEYQEATKGVPVSKGKTYYIGVANDYSSGTMKALVNPYVICSLSSRTLSQGTSKWTLASGMNQAGSVSTTYFKVVPDRTGTMTVSLNEYSENYSSDGYVALLNKDKKALSDKVYYNSKYNDDRVYFGVKKGNTYYLKVTDCNGFYPNYVYGIRYSMTSRIDRDLGTKSKAKKLTRKADATNTLFVASTSNSTDWYKISVTSKRKTVVRINTAGIKSGNVYVTVYNGSKKVGSDTISASKKQVDYTVTYGTTYGKANAGTYYIKLVKGTKASGKYTIRYVQ